MKKFMMIAVMAVAALTANAQAFIGGEIGFGFASEKFSGEKKTTVTTFAFQPTVGYQFGNAAAGIHIGLGTTKVNTWDKSATNFMLEGFGLYNFANTDKFHFGLEAAVGYQSYGKNVGGEQLDKNVAAITLALRPVFTFDVSDGVSFVGKCNLFSWAKYNEAWDKASFVNIGVFSTTQANPGSANLASTPALEMGVIFKL